MRTSGLVGCAFQAFAVHAVLTCFWAFRHPQLFVLALVSAFFALVSVLLTSLLHCALPHNDGTKALFVCAAILLQEAFRALVSVLIIKGERHFRLRHQVLHASRFRVLLPGAAVGYGFGLLIAAVGFGALLEEHSHVAVDDATLYNMDVCPTAALLVHVVACLHDAVHLQLVLGRVGGAVHRCCHAYERATEWGVHPAAAKHCAVRGEGGVLRAPVDCWLTCCLFVRNARQQEGL